MPNIVKPTEGDKMKYTDFLVTVHQRYVLYASEVRFADCFMERLKEERPDIVERLGKTGRKTVKKNGKTIVTQEVFSFIKDVWDRTG
jgi:hypothetical protein